MPYLFTHFKEKYTPDGEQVYFSISRDGYNWEKVNDGNPILTARLGEKGCRDIEIVRLHTGGFVILTTDCVLQIVMTKIGILTGQISIVQVASVFVCGRQMTL